MHIGILGPLTVSTDADDDIPLNGVRLRALLTRLALDAGHDVSQTELIDAVWPDDPPRDVANALQSLVSRLRRTLGEPTLVAQARTGYRLAVAAECVDAHQFTELASVGRRALAAGDAPAAAEALQSASRLWRGEPLLDAAGAADVVAAAARLTETRVAATTDRIAAELQLGYAAALVGELEGLVAAYPLREQFASQLMTALAETGRTAEALAVFDSLRRRLAEQLGVDPGAAIREQHVALLRGDAAGGGALGRRVGGAAHAGRRPRTNAGAHTGAGTGTGPAGPHAGPDTAGPNAAGRNAAGRDPGSAYTPAALRTNLRSAASSFVGREAELARLATLVQHNRLTTIVGPGGAGKTRLAMEAAAPLVDHFDDGVWLVELAPVTDHTMIPQAVLGAFGHRDARLMDRRQDSWVASASDRVIDVLAESDVTVVIDNCEHLIGAVAEFVEMVLTRCPRVRVLATSREPLGLAGEAMVPIPPLAVPPPNADAETAAHYPAVQLLLARGRAARPEFAVSPENVSAVVDIVRRLDGLPLAIELAAARLRVLPVTEIAARLSDRFRLLAGGLRTSVARHRTLRAVVEWSWDLLTDAERRLAERLAIFPGGVTAETARQVCADDGVPADDIPDLLLALADKSLVQVGAAAPAPRSDSAGTSAGPRFRMLETIREYGVERLDENGELAQVRRRHAEYFRGRAHTASALLRTRRQLEALNEFSVEMDNFLAAVRFLGDSGSPLVAELVCDLCWYWTITSGHSEMVDWTGFALRTTDDSDPSPRARLEGLNLIGRLTQPVEAADSTWSDLTEQVTRAGAALARVDDGTDVQVAILRITLEFFASRGGNIEELTARGRSSNDPWLVAMTAMMRVMWLENNGDVDRLRREVDPVCEAFDTLGDRWGLSSVIAARAGVRALDGDTDGAIEDYLRVLTLLDELGAVGDDMFAHLRLADMYSRKGDFALADAHVEAVRRGRAGAPVPLERSLMADVAEVGVLLMRGEYARANDRGRELVAQAPGAATINPMFGHVDAVVRAVCALAAVNVGDLPTAREHLLRAYPAAVGTHDRPIIASLATAIVAYAVAVERHADAAEILGAADALRGAEDLSDGSIARIRAELIDALGQERFVERYGSGRALDKEAAEKRIDPALL